jgi:flagellar basal body-associated protein FliL
MQLYLLLVRVVPDTPIPIYINMFTTVLKTYTLILLSYMAFILSFAYSFFLVFSERQKPVENSNGTTAIPTTVSSNSTTNSTTNTTSPASAVITDDEDLVIN